MSYDPSPMFPRHAARPFPDVPSTSLARDIPTTLDCQVPLVPTPPAGKLLQAPLVPTPPAGNSLHKPLQLDNRQFCVALIRTYVKPSSHPDITEVMPASNPWPEVTPASGPQPEVTPPSGPWSQCTEVTRPSGLWSQCTEVTRPSGLWSQCTELTPASNPQPEVPVAHSPRSKWPIARGYPFQWPIARGYPFQWPVASGSPRTPNIYARHAPLVTADLPTRRFRFSAPLAPRTDSRAAEPP
uniref:Uncharacterized protein n=1 Tax=Branchiostoma floridae TaxID=7739 RepID=C3ZZ53_BRAFL|eukprot:XP_002586153.1 hypothetical protein BRAFLDRAFT_109850 [Branchiostoma floridae]